MRSHAGATLSLLLDKESRSTKMAEGATYRPFDSRAKDELRVFVQSTGSLAARLHHDIRPTEHQGPRKTTTRENSGDQTLAATKTPSATIDCEEFR